MQPSGIEMEEAAGVPDGRSEDVPTGWPRWYVGAWIAAGVLLLVGYAWIQLGLGGARVTRLFSDGLVAAVAIGAALAVTRLARRPDASVRRGWLLLGAGLWFEVLGETTWTGYVAVTGSVPYPGLADVFYIAGYPLLVAGLVTMAVDHRDSRPRIRLTLDGLVVAAALLTFGWHFAIQPLLASSDPGSLETWVTLFYPAGDIVLASIALVVATNARGPRMYPLLLVAVGFFSWALGDLSFAIIETGGTYLVDALGLLWLVGYLAIVLGALHRHAGDPPAPAERRHFSFVELMFPFAPFLLALGLGIALGFLGDLDRGDILLGALTTVFLVARQVHVSAETTRLTGDLEASERTVARRNDQLLLINRIVRHDIRNDMNVAHGWAEELTGHVDEEGEGMLDRVLRTTQHTIDLTKDLRDFVETLEEGKDGSREAVPLRTTLLETVQSRRETYPEATFTADEVSDVDVEANALLETVFRNILNNAVQHNDADEPRVDVTTEVVDGTVRVRIADDGPGVPDAMKGTVFGRDEAGLENPGSGVGLYLVDTLVTQYGGDVWIEDDEPRGAVVVVELAIAE